MLEQLEKVRKEENRTRSELMREALRQYIENHYPVVTATKAELAGIRKGRAEIQRGQHVNLLQLRNELDTAHRKKSAKGAQKTAR